MIANDSLIKHNTHEFKFQQSLYANPKQLIITDQRIILDKTEITQHTFNDVKYLSEHIVWYKFYVGVEYCIDIKYNDTQVLPIRFSRYFGKNKHYRQMYTDISRCIGNYFLLNKVSASLDQFDETGTLEISSVRFAKAYLSFNTPSQTVPWANVRVKEYPSYFVIYDKAIPAIHKRITFNEWNSELLFNVLKSLTDREDSSPDC